MKSAPTLNRPKMKPKLTPWYPPEIKPCSDVEHQGEYLRLYPVSGAQCFDYWDGDQWMYGKNDGRCLFQDRPWRGLAEKP